MFKWIGNYILRDQESGKCIRDCSSIVKTTMFLQPIKSLESIFTESYKRHPTYKRKKMKIQYKDKVTYFLLILIFVLQLYLASTIPKQNKENNCIIKRD